jgi:hypothetical protein
MSNFKLKVTVALVCVLLVAFAAPALAVVYNPGVSVGQYVKYGNIVGIGPGMESANNTDWMKIEVAAVSGKNVTLRTSGQFKNGTAAPTSTAIYNVETGMMNGTPSTFGPIISANLNVGDTIPPSIAGLTINRTETRTYMSINRSVNILNMTMSMTGISYKQIVIYDKASGIALEIEMSTTITMPTPQTMKISYNVVDTNIFAAGAGGWPIEYTIYIVITVIAVIVVIAAIVFSRIRK